MRNVSRNPFRAFTYLLNRTEQVKEGKEKLMGFGHRVYRNFDPRARQMKVLARECIEMYAGAPHTAVRGPQHWRVLARARSAAALP